ncbi:DNA polymerase/3'-5' exonuclease PolX [Haloplanus rubicundus]|uniref:DNA polymerase beta n=1 Tax=Haloplanus rubicundus TaxID=1547898 RepID=A0A345EC74_9EURY|nr:DNA polymerase/3'-5' exonuclease PolX [Haloplanus rubicundus]AXG09796.1 DNA polymerase/3'-5' exonuclease PolX [Haloplanus rubicundus]
MKNQEIATMLREIADFLEIQEEEYKPRAYRTAARNIESLSEDIEDIHDRGELEEIEGVGESISEKIGEYLETGELEYYEDLKADLPVDIEAITSVEGVGPKTAKKLYLELDVRTLDDLESAAEKGDVADLEGFGEKSQQNILDHIGRAKESQERMLLGRAFPIAQDIETRLHDDDAFDQVDIVGSFRRRRPTVGDIDILATAPDPEAAMEVFCSHDDVKEVLSRGETKSSVVVSGDLQMDLRVVDETEYGAALVYFTGSKDHNITLRNRAIDHDWKLNEYGLFDVGDIDDGEGERRAGETEDGVYDTLDLDWIPPELREDTGEVDAAATGDLPNLIELDEVRGDLQLHTDYSDGSHSVREMAEAAVERDLEYILVTDHGPHAPIPSTLDRDSFEEQQADIETVNDDLDITVLQGIEAEITDSGLELSDDWYEHCDLIVAGMHSDPSNSTERVVTALQDFPVDIFAHPSNRLINEREPLNLDMETVMETAAEEDVAVEINAQPERLDLDWASVKEYRETVSYVVSTDAHTTGELDFMHLGIAQARRGWCEASNILNTRSLDDVRSVFEI